ncbi:AI-2E family transporter [Psychroflexus sp. YR1-1]|uniref:AI-2E family transporter n=1 Tax=Psychroflexus aurantiacus TaxID=2709310 RepID=A0A6B3R0L3_9FLAO|nr:AI-2E family transporter [Psychroflexus aurantiacus]NEV93732.1 AI-2E family transporter [Psychroflexus aurantiacus]
MARSKLQKINSVLLFSFLLIIGLYYGAPFLIPLTFGVFLTTLMIPICNFLENKLNLGRIIASFLSTFLLFIVIGGLFFLLFSQLNLFINDLLERKGDVFGFVDKVRQQIVDSTGFTLKQQNEMFNERLYGMLKQVQTHLSNVFSEFINILVSFLLTLIYVFLFLINRKKFHSFLMKYISEEKKQNTKQILDKAKNVANRYLWGRIQVMFVLGLMYAITFLAYDLEYTALLLIFGVLVTIIPYIGPFLSGLLPILFMLVISQNSTEIISFTILIIIIQLIESYVLEPLLIGSEVKQSPLFIIIAIVLGGAIWGFAGLILFVPLFGVMKIIFDHTPELKPAGFLIGYEESGAKLKFLSYWKNKIMGREKGNGNSE